MHVARRHYAGGAEWTKDDSTCDPGVDLDDMIEIAQDHPSRCSEQSDGRLRRVADAGRIIGVDTGGLPTKLFTVVTESNGTLATMYPGWD
ncbi:MAG: hypothetical protein QOE76_3800 [Frankiales bacterium]|nr:hypothetical protein [Frankiales bacterium]